MDLSLTLLGGLMQKTTTTTKFSNPLQTSKNFRASFLSWKLQVNPIENHINSIWTEKFVIFFKAPLRGSKILRSPPTSVCEWSLIKCWCHGLRGGDYEFPCQFYLYLETKTKLEFAIFIFLTGVLQLVSRVEGPYQTQVHMTIRHDISGRFEPPNWVETSKAIILVDVSPFDF